MATQEEILKLALQITGQRDAETLKTSLEGLGSTAGATGAEIDKMVSELDAVVAASRKLEQFATGTASLAELEAKLLQARTGLQELNKEFDGTGKRTGEVGKAFKAAEKAVADLEKEQAKQVKTLDTLGGQLTAAGVDTTKLASESDRLRGISQDTAKSLQDKSKALREAKEQAEQSAARWKQLADQLQNVREQSNAAAGKIAAVGAAAAAAVAALAVYGAQRFFRAGLEDAAEFEVALGKIQAAAGLTDDAMVSVKQSIEETAAAASRDVGDAAKAFEELAREGLNADEAMAALKPSLDFVTASGQETKAGIASLSGVMDGFNRTGAQTAETADIIAAASLAGGTAIADMAASLAKAGPTATALNIELDTTAAALAVLARNGVEGGRAGSQLSTIFRELQDPTSKFRAELSALGIESTDFNTVLDELAARGAGAEAVFNALGGNGSTALRLLTKESAGVRALTTELKDATGAIATAAETINRDFITSFGNVGRAFSDLRRQLLAPLLEPMRLELDELSERLRTFAASPEFESIRASLVKIFKAGVEAVKGFTESVDFSDIGARIARFADTAATQFSDVAKNAKTAMDAVVTAVAVADVAMSGFVVSLASASAVFFKIAETKALGELQLAESALERVRGKASATADELERYEGYLEAARLKYESLSKSADSSFSIAAAAAERVRNGLGLVEEKAADVGAEVAAIGPAVEGALDSVPRQAAAAADALDDLSDAVGATEASLETLGVESQTAIERIGDGVDKGIEALQTLGVANKDVTDEIRADWTAARDELVNRATEIAQKIQAELAGLNREEVLSSLRAELAATTELSGRFDDALKATAKALDEVAKKAPAAAQEIAKVAPAAEATAGAVFSVEKAADAASFSLGAMSQAAADLYRELNDQLGIGGYAAYAKALNGITQRVSQQRDAAQDRLRQLDQELARYDPLAQKLELLRSQYALVDDATLQQIAQRETRLAQQQERADRESARATEQIERLQQQQSRQDGPPARDPVFRFEVIVRNEQRTGGILAELSDRDLDQLAQMLLQRIAQLRPF